MPEQNTDTKQKLKPLDIDPTDLINNTFFEFRIAYRLKPDLTAALPSEKLLPAMDHNGNKIVLVRGADLMSEDDKKKLDSKATKRIIGFVMKGMI